MKNILIDSAVVIPVQAGIQDQEPLAPALFELA